MIPFKTRVLHSESGIFQHISANNILYITGDQTISGLKSFDRRPTFNGTGFLLSGEASSTLGGEYYLNNNPSGFITGVDTSNFYTNDNLSGFITGVDTSTLYPRSNPSGYITGYDTGLFYASSNPSGYVSSNVTNINGATALKNMMQITQSGYNSLGGNVATDTLYIIVG